MMHRIIPNGMAASVSVDPLGMWVQEYSDVLMTIAGQYVKVDNEVFSNMPRNRNS
jgi:hypothetical protein